MPTGSVPIAAGRGDRGLWKCVLKKPVQFCHRSPVRIQEVNAGPMRSICSNAKYDIEARGIAERSEVAVSREEGITSVDTGLGQGDCR